MTQVLDYAQQIAQGLSKAHAKGIVHRDIKSENIMVTSDGLVKIMDFGLAKLKGKAGMTRAGSTVGTAAYMSPEQVRGEEVDEQADIWSYGVVLFQVLTGQLPFHGDHESAIMYSITNENPKPLAGLRSDVPAALQQIIEHCLQKDLSRRYSTTSELHEDLSKLQQAAVVQVSPLSFKGIVKSLRRPVISMPIVLVLIGMAYFSSWYVGKSRRIEWARQEAIPEIQKLVNENFRPPTQAYDMAMEAEKYIPKDSALIKLWPTISTTISIETEPAGAEVYWKDYHTPDADWRLAGITPLQNVRFPRSYLRMEIRKKGYQTIEYAGPWAYGRLGPDIAHLKLDTMGSLPENMVRVPKNVTQMLIVGLEQHGGKEVGEFLMDRFEVTNIQFKTFMDAGGYTNKTYWNYPIYSNGKELTLESALVLFVDHTGRQGPANWEAGTYPDGQKNYPVTGVSWYEAAAYAVYANKQLPTVFHWSRVVETSRTEFIVPLSNYNGKSSTPVGSMAGYNTFGIYDLAGNAREWCFNESNNVGQRFILGGGWNDPRYSFNDSYTQSVLDRSVANGFRCIKELSGDTTIVQLTKSVTMAFRDYRKEKPVDENTFNIFLKQFTYDKSPLNAEVEATIEGEFWTAEKITFDARYNNERMEAYLYLPKNFQAPFQTILFFPGSGDIFSKKFNPEAITGRIDFILKSGRALVWPIYKGTHERHDDLKSDLQEETVFYKDHVIMWRKDIGRTLDYLETRNDIQNDKIGFLGWSWGGFMGGIFPAVEKRIKAVVLNVGGMGMTKALPEVDQINFLPPVVQPVLMLNGKHDMFFPVETSQKPMFDLFGTLKENKKMIIYESGHLVPRTDFVKETLFWYDQYLGPVK